MLVLRELAMGRAAFPGSRPTCRGSREVLAQRLGELEERRLVRKVSCRRRHRSRFMRPPSGGGGGPVIAALGKWAARSPPHDPNLPMSHVSVMMSLQTLLSPELAQGLDARFGFRLGDVSYVATLAEAASRLSAVKRRIAT